MRVLAPSQAASGQLVHPGWPSDHRVVSRWSLRAGFLLDRQIRQLGLLVFILLVHHLRASSAVLSACGSSASDRAVAPIARKPEGWKIY